MIEYLRQSLVVLLVIGVAQSGGSIETRDSPANEKQVEFINNGVVNSFAGIPAGTGKSKEDGKQENVIETTDYNRFITLAFVNVTWYDGKMQLHKRDMQERSKYGMGKVMDVEGSLVHITDELDLTDHSACNVTIRGTHGRPLPTQPWIALIKRGGCDFEQKILNVYRAHAIGVIIYNNMSGNDLNYMKIMNKELLEGNITSIFTTMNKGDEYSSLLASYPNVTVEIKAGSRFEKKFTNSHRSSVLFVTISFIVVMVISMLWLVVYYFQRFRYLQTKENEQKMDSNKAKEALRKIPTRTLKTISKELESDCCAVCIEAYKINDVIRTLPCRHEFHKGCIDPWLLEDPSHSCPLCKARVLKQYGYVNIGSQESIIILDMDDDDSDSPDQTRRRYSVSPMPQIRSSESQTSGRSSSDDSDNDEHSQAIEVHKPMAINICIDCIEKKSPMDQSNNFNGSASLPARFGVKCRDCRQSVQSYHQTLDSAKIKKNNKKMRPPLSNLMQSPSSNCDIVGNCEEYSENDISKV